MSHELNQIEKDVDDKESKQLIDFEAVERTSSHSDDAYSEYRGLQDLFGTLQKGNTVDLAKNSVPENVVCIGGQCFELTKEEADAERAKLKEGGNTFEVLNPKGNIPDNVKCVGNDCRILTPEELVAEKTGYENAARLAACCANCCIPENIKCASENCNNLSPEQRAKLQAENGNVCAAAASLAVLSA